jgi:hypothetical protein
MKTKRVAVGELLHKDEIYPRGNIDGYNVSKLRQVLRDGGELDRMIVDEKTLIILDGTHRARAYVLERGAEYEVEVETVRCRDLKAMGLRALELNRKHGKPLDSFDQATWIARMKRLGAKTNELMAAMGMSEKSFEKLMVRKTSPSTDAPIRRDVGHLAGKKLTKTQRRAVEGPGPWVGHPQIHTVRTVTHLLENNLIDTSRQDMLEALSNLHEALAAWWAKHGVEV